MFLLIELCSKNIPKFYSLTLRNHPFPSLWLMGLPTGSNFWVLGICPLFIFYVYLCSGKYREQKIGRIPLFNIMLRAGLKLFQFMLGQVQTSVSVTADSGSYYEDKEYDHINKPSPLLVSIF